jgi:phosphatidylserine/phosphatidylglycerophosphate/cardiolipin synthase-like enzyme
MIPFYTQERVRIMVPYLVRSEILNSILQLPDNLQVELYTRDASGYLPNIKSGAQPALDQLREKSNLDIYIDNRIHAKIWLIDNRFALVHSMNGTFHSENINFEAGIVSTNSTLIAEIHKYFDFVENEAKKIA